MAYVVRTSTNSNPIRLKTFLGLHESPDGDTQLAFGEAPVMRNLRITSRTGEKRSRGGHLQTRPGNKTIIGLLKGYDLAYGKEEEVISEKLTTTETGVMLYGYKSAEATYDGFVNLKTDGNPFNVNWEFLESTEEENIYFNYGYDYYKFVRFVHIDNDDDTFTFKWFAKKVTVTPNTDNDNYKIQGLWSGTVNGYDTLLAVCNGHVWSLWDYKTASYKKEIVGDIDCTNRCTMFAFDTYVYLINGKEYKVFDGEKCEDVIGYRPMIAVMDADGNNGQLIEQVNKLTGARRVWFNGDGETTTYQLPEKDIITVDWVHWTNDDSEMNPSEYSFDAQAGTVTFNTAPEEGQKNVEIAYTANNIYRHEVESMMFAEIFNGAQANRVILYGNGTNQALFSDVDYWQKARADYFPDLNEIGVGASDSPIMDMCRHGTSLLCNKIDEAYIIDRGEIKDADGLITTAFYTKPINKIIGSSVPGQMRMVSNNPRFIFGKELYEWISQNRYGSITFDERQASRISDRIYNTLSKFNMKETYCFDFNYGQEYYIANNGTVLVNNYANDTWYMYTDIDMYCAVEFLGELYFGTKDGNLQKFSEEYSANDGKEIECWWESGYMDFGYDNMRKATSYIYVVLNPQSRGKMRLSAVTDRRAAYATKEVSADIFDFHNIDFADMTFNTNDAAKSKRVKLKLKKYVFMKLILKSAGIDTRFTALSVDIETRLTGKAK